LNAFPGFGLFAGATGSDPSDRFVDRMARHFVTQHVIVWQADWLQICGAATTPMRGRQDRAGRSDENVSC